jgi:hypothetical protein
MSGVNNSRRVHHPRVYLGPNEDAMIANVVERDCIGTAATALGFDPSGRLMQLRSDHLGGKEVLRRGVRVVALASVSCWHRVDV